MTEATSFEPRCRVEVQESGGARSTDRPRQPLSPALEERLGRWFWESQRLAQQILIDNRRDDGWVQNAHSEPPLVVMDHQQLDAARTVTRGKLREQLIELSAEVFDRELHADLELQAAHADVATGTVEDQCQVVSSPDDPGGTSPLAFCPAHIAATEAPRPRQ